MTEREKTSSQVLVLLQSSYSTTRNGGMVTLSHPYILHLTQDTEIKWASVLSKRQTSLYNDSVSISRLNFPNCIEN